MSENDTNTHQPDAFDKLTAYEKRKFVPEGADLLDLQTLTDLLETLLAREINTADEMEKWMADWSELAAASGQAGGVLYVRMTCQTDDESYAKAYQDFVENVEPAVKPLADKLNRKYLDAREKLSLAGDRYDLFTKGLQIDVNLFRQENIPIETKLSLLSKEYQSLCGAMTVEFEGRQQTLAAMAAYQQRTDRDLRERAWHATAQRRLDDAEKLENIFDEMLELRGQLAQNAGYDNYMLMRFDSLHRFDYGPQQCVEYHQAVEQHVVPLWKKVLEKRREIMGLEKLRPWDLSVDPQGREPLKPFDKADELIEGVGRMFCKLDSDLGRQFEEMKSLGMLDLASRKGKAPGGYQMTMQEARKPFIFMNAVGLDRDVRTLLHEGGHAFHALAAADEPLIDYRHAPMEFCEVASMSMELLANKVLDEFYEEDDLQRSIITQLEDVLMILGWIATIDAFQHWLYTNPGHSRQQRREQWLKTLARFDGQQTDWSELEDFRAYRWHAQLHLFEVPFYYIEYGIAQLGALQIWSRAAEDHAQALADYKKALALGGSEPLGELFTAAGIKFDFSAETIAPLTQKVAAQLESFH